MFENDRIRLRAIEPEDLDWLYKVENDDALWSYGSSNVPYSTFALKQYIASCHNDLYADGQLRLVAEDSVSHTVIGCVDLVDFTPRHMRAEIGIFLFPQFQGKGYACEIIQMICDYARNFMFMHLIYAIVAEENLRARKLFEKCGFENQSIIKEWLRFSHDEYSSAYLFIKVL